MKVKREAFSCFGLLHQQVGPSLKSVAITLAKQAAIKDQLQKCFDENPFDSSLLSASWARTSIVGRGREPIQSPSALALDVPKTDLCAALPPDIIAMLVR